MIMAEWKIYSTSNVVRATVKELELHDEWMGECFLSVTVKSAEPISFDIGDYIDYRGERYTINYDPTVLKKARRGSYAEGFTYDSIKFVSIQDELVRCDFNDIVLNDNNIHYTALPTFPFYCETVDDLLDRIQANLEDLYPGQWTVISTSRTRTEQRGQLVGRTSDFTRAYQNYIGVAPDVIYNGDGQGLSADNNTCWDALKMAHDYFSQNFIVRGRTVIVGVAGVNMQNKLKYGKGNGLYEIERIGDPEQQIITRLRAYGSETNLPTRYYATLNLQVYARVTRIKNLFDYENTPGIDFILDLDFSNKYFTFRSRSYPGTDTAPNYIVKMQANGHSVIGYITKDSQSNKSYVYCEYTGGDDDRDEPDRAEMRAFSLALKENDIIYFTGYVEKGAFGEGHHNYATQNLPDNMAVSRLMLPGFPNKTLKQWVQENRPELIQEGFVFSTSLYRPYIDSPNKSKYGIRPASIFFDGSGENEDIHPTIVGMTNLGVRVDEIVSADQITDNGVYGEGDVPNFRVTIRNVGFDLAAVWNTGSSLDMTDGMCGTRSFEIASAPSKNSEGNWILELKRCHDEALDLWFPYDDFQIKAGDRFVFIGIDMPDAYVAKASERLFDAAIEALRKNHAPRYTFQPRIDELWMQRQHDQAVKLNQVSVHDTIKAGDIFNFEDADLGIDTGVVIDILTIKENGNNGIPTYDITLRDEKQVSGIQKIQEKVSTNISSVISQGSHATATNSGVVVSGEYLSKEYDDKTPFNLGVGGDLTVDGLIWALQARINELRSQDYSGSGIGDTGWLLTNAHNGHSYLEVDELLVRMKATFMELEIRKETFSGGNVHYSPAGSVLYRVDYLTDDDLLLGYTEVKVPWLLKAMPFLLSKYAYSARRRIRRELTDEEWQRVGKFRCYMVADDGTTATRNWWQVGDQARCQTFNKAISVENKHNNIYGTTSHSISDPTTPFTTDFYWRMVVGVGSAQLEDGKVYDYVDFAYADAIGPDGRYKNTESERNSHCMQGSGIPAAGDTIVCMGNRYNADRMNMVSILTYGADSPAIKGYKGINTFSMENTQVFNISPKSVTIRSKEFKWITDEGKEIPNALNRGDWEYGTRYHYYDLVSHNGSMWLCLVLDAYEWQNRQGTTFSNDQVVNIVEGEGNFVYTAPGIEGDDVITGIDHYYKKGTSRSGQEVFYVRAYTYSEPKDTNTLWLKQVSKGTEITDSITRYAASKDGINHPLDDAENWKSTIGETGIKAGQYLWTRVVTYYSDGREPTKSYSCSRWGIDGDGIALINSYYWATNEVIQDMAAYEKTNTVPWKDKFSELGDLGEMQGYYVWEKTVIKYDLHPDDDGNARTRPDLISYKVNRIGADALLGQEEYYCLLPTNDISTAFANIQGWNETDKANWGIPWYGGSYAKSEGGRLAVNGTIKDVWQAQMPTYVSGANKYLWNFEWHVAGDGTEFATTPRCIGNHAKGITGIIELYACSTSKSPRSNGKLPTDIYEANDNSETSYIENPDSDQIANLRVWTDERYDRAPNDTYPYQWNMTITLYSDGTKEYHYHVSAVKGTKGEDGAGSEFIYKRTKTDAAPSTPSNPTDRNIDDYVPTGWTDNPTGINFTWQYEWVSQRTKKTGGSWGDFSTPARFSKWGKNGQDGDGVEYVFIRSKSATAPKISDSSTAYNGKEYTDDDYLPLATGTDLENEGRCSDDPKGVTETWPYEYCIMRSKDSANAETGVRAWKAYTGTFALWANWSKDGQDGKDGNGVSSTSTKYARSSVGTTANDTTAPEINGVWSDSIPTLTDTYPYLWKKEETNYTKADSVTRYTMIGHRGKNGENGGYFKFIYKANDGTPDKPSGNAVSPEGWSDNPAGVSIPRTSISLTGVTTLQGNFTSSGNKTTSGYTANNAMSVCRLYFTTPNDSMYLIIKAVASSEGGYDYGIVGAVDADTIVRPGSNQSPANAVSGTEVKEIKVLIAKAGTHYVTVAYSKDSSSTAGNDNVSFEILGAENTDSAIWVSQGYIINNSCLNGWSNPVRWNGPAGAKGADGQDGQRGKRGYAIRGPREWKYGSGEEYQAGEDGDDFLDIVIHNGSYYRCLHTHSGSSEIEPGVSTWWWGAATDFDFVATKVLLAEKAYIENLVVKEVQTALKGVPHIEAEGSTFKIYGNGIYPAIELATEVWSGTGGDNKSHAVLRFFNEHTGAFLYDLGPDGIMKSFSEVADRWNEIFLRKVSNYVSDINDIINITQSQCNKWYQFIEGYKKLNSNIEYHVSKSSTPSDYHFKLYSVKNNYYSNNPSDGWYVEPNGPYANSSYYVVTMNKISGGKILKTVPVFFKPNGTLCNYKGDTISRSTYPYLYSYGEELVDSGNY